ncbi:zeta toxin family protein [Rubinisphaera margarita]|uniref:zeta toxin family protein n=1 Tax=Rubinisphaera margarita TaxID=2909586 RepID=UPI001EE88281|nr:zeta toxin family protein [Rubinisphaera margarita]MCG6155360.1 zeta toxin family protein [Rubinisphaera margarita]
MEKPQLYVIAGPNGAGKTTFARDYLPDFVECREFLNADLIAAGLAPFAPETQNVQAGRLLLKRIEELAMKNASFGFETTLSGRTYARLFTNLRNSGYEISLFFLWLPTPDLAVRRVSNRVCQGGHHIEESDIRRRYVLGLQNLFELYNSRVDSMWFYDATLTPPLLVARKGTEEAAATIFDEARYQSIQSSRIR